MTGNPIKVVDRLTLKARVADHLGMSYGQFQSMCYEKYPNAPDPLMAYIEDPENHADTSGPGRIRKDLNGPVKKLSRVRCRWCGERCPPVHRAVACSPECDSAWQKFRNNKNSRRHQIRWLIKNGSDPAKYERELEAIELGLLPRLGRKFNPPRTIQNLREMGTEQAARVLAMLEEETEED